jgi:hypothetical protein
MPNILQDEKELIEKKDEDTVELWKKRFKEAENFRRPIDERNLRMYKLYRAYRDWNSNYAYNTNLMPPIGYEVIETVKPRLSSAKINTRILPTKKEDIENPSLQKWDNLIHYYLDIMDFSNKKVEWIDSQLKYGNGVSQFTWDSTKQAPEMTVCDNWLTYIDPQSEPRLKGCRWIIKRSWKEKEIIQKEEKEREDPLYDEVKVMKLENESVQDDPRRNRRELSGKKMSQINDAMDRDNSSETESAMAEHAEYKSVEIWECYDFIKQEIVTIANRQEVIRQDENDYKGMNKDRNPGNTFVDLPNIILPWEYYAIPLLEPVETTIYEIADSRNQAMDNIVLNLDPITKIRKGKGYKESDFKKGPGAMWFIERADDIITERPMDIGNSWIEKDEILRREIQTSLAMSEYTQGMPQSSQEPMGKVELLLMQTNIRFSTLVRQMENSFQEMINILVEMSQEFLSEEKAFRIVGKDFEFEQFTEADKQVYIDARVDIIPKKEKSPAEEANDAMELYRMFVLEDPPTSEDPQELFRWQKKKAELQKMILEKMGYEEYEDLLVLEPKEPVVEQPIEPEQPMEQPPQPIPEPVEMIPEEGGQMTDINIPQQLQQIPEKEPMLPPEQGLVPESSVGQEPSPGLLKRLMNKLK